VAKSLERNTTLGYIFIFFTIILNVLVHVTMKYVISIKYPLVFTQGSIKDILLIVLNPWIIGCFVAMLFSFLSWAMVLSKFNLSYAYPFTALSYAIVVIISCLFFDEPINSAQIIGNVLVTVGVCLIARS
jgi:Membrane transporters of cations and cationic drugs